MNEKRGKGEGEGVREKLLSAPACLRLAGRALARRVLRAFVSSDARSDAPTPAPFAASLPSIAARLSMLVVSLALACAFSPGASAQKRPKPALSEKDARRAIAAMPGFELKTSAVKVKEVSAATVAPVRVVADVTLAVRFARAAEEGAAQNGGLLADKRWRAAEFRAGDREWESFDAVSAAAGDARVEDARRALERLVEEYEAHLKMLDERDAGGESSGAGGEPFVRGPLSLRSFSALGSSAVAEVAVEATFTLARDSARKWRVVEFSSGEGSSGDLEALLFRVNARKAGVARRDLEELRAALEEYRRERGFYVAAEDVRVLVDHLSPRFLVRVIRIDPWHRPYRYEGTETRYFLSSDGADGVANTADDLRLSGGL